MGMWKGDLGLVCEEHGEHAVEKRVGEHLGQRANIIGGEVSCVRVGLGPRGASCSCWLHLNLEVWTMLLL